jgi:hypothetical protein
MGHRADDEHMNLPTWRVRQLQDIEHAAREVVEVYRKDMPRLRGSSLDERAAMDRLTEALGED